MKSKRDGQENAAGGVKKDPAMGPHPLPIEKKPCGKK